MNNSGKYIIYQSDYAPFPHESRSNGYTYRGKIYEFKDHYDCSDVLIFVPSGYRNWQNINMVFYFHGWNDNIQKSVKKFELLKQFTESRKNAIFIFCETTVNAPDSSGGKFEDINGFNNFLNDLTGFLVKEKVLLNNNIDNITLSGHSGAYRIIAYIIANSGIKDKIANVFIFDGLYAEVNKYYNWAINKNTVFYVVSTIPGGTRNICDRLINKFANNGISYNKFFTDEPDLVKMKYKRIIFFYTQKLRHEDAINPFFKIFLKAIDIEDI